MSAVLVYWALYPTLTGYLSRALLGSDSPSAFLALLGLMEYPLVGFGLAWLSARSQSHARHHARLVVIVLLIYAGAQLAAHFLLNLQSVNLRLVANANPAVADAAVDRIRESGDPAALPRLQQK